jgi:hypothetical protein
LQQLDENIAQNLQPGNHLTEEDAGGDAKQQAEKYQSGRIHTSSERFVRHCFSILASWLSLQLQYHYSLMVRFELKSMLSKSYQGKFFSM